MLETENETRRVSRRKQAIFDCDVHPTLADPGDINRYMDPAVLERLQTFGLRAPHPNGYYATLFRAAGARVDAYPPDGGQPGSDLAFMREQLLDRWDIGRAILNPIAHLYFAEQPERELAFQLTSALNQWTIDEWLVRDERFLAALCVPYEFPDLAVEEIHRHGSDDRFVQVFFNAPTREPLGGRKYWPIYEAATEHQLPIMIHVGAIAGNRITASGLPPTYFEFHNGFCQAYQDELVSLVFSGVFKAIPGLRFVFTEGGFAWVLPLMWRMDRAWHQLRSEVPHVERPPSEYVREHIWFTTQPMEEPERKGDLVSMLEEMSMTDHLMFASDYPHWDFDPPGTVLPRELGDDVVEAIMSGNARNLYRGDH